jgi:iron complex outermembrane receptor protein
MRKTKKENVREGIRMLTGKIYRRVSMAALAIGTWGLPAAYAQASDQPAPVEQVQPPAEEEDTRDRVIVTGSNIATAAEDAPLPVEVYTADDSFKQGGQTALEFTKSLSVVGSTVGETNQFQAGYASIGAATLNLRGLGGGRTLSIFNGRRFSENINMIPSIALARTEILKDGGAVIYGADATGGVVNFITRDSFNGFIADGQYKFVDGSDGDYNLSFLWGTEFENGNVMASYEYGHRSELDMLEREWTVQPFSRNNTPWAPYHNYATYLLRSAAGGTLGVVADWDRAGSDCENSTGPVQGQDLTLSGLPVCWWNYAIHTYNLVEETDQHRAYFQVTNDLSNTTRFTGQIAYGKSNAPKIGTVASYQANVGPANASGTAFQFRVPRSNPYFNSFLTQNASQINPLVLPLIASADQFLSIFFGPSGAPHLPDGEGTMPTTELENWNAVAALDGEFGDFAGDWLDTWKISGTFNYATVTTTLPDTIGYRVQNALNGFGGPNCNAVDLVPDRFDLASLDTNSNGSVSAEEWNAVVGIQNPGAAGTNGCMYLNPFASAYAANGTFGTPNPRYIAGNEISPELAAWLYDERWEESVSTNLTVDALVSGGLPFELPGGPIAWAAGAQWRQSEFRDQSRSDFMDPDIQNCAWPGQNPGDVGCAPTGESPFFFFGQNGPSRSDQQQYSYFGELQVPVLDNLSMQLAVRREEFPQSGLGATVYKVAGKWDPVDWLSVRGSFGTNYATPPASFIPGQVTNALSLIANAGNRYLRVETETLSGVSPETAEVANFGAIVFLSDLPLNGTLRASADYFDFTIIDEIKTVSHNGILNTVFVASPGTNNPINCSAPLIDRITFINGQGAAGCTQGTTTGNDVTSIRSVRGNGPGANTSGIDYDVTYSFEALGGDMSASVTATNVLAYEIDAFVLNGTPLTPAVDGLGFANYSRDGDIVSEWRGNASLNYSAGDHNLRYVMRYIQGVTDDRFIGTANEQIDDFVTSNLYYQYTMPFDENFVLSFSVENLMDEDPPFTVQQYSYDPFIGNPLGRTYEIGLRKTF